MVKIKRGDEVRTVTSGAFKNFYSAHGWVSASAENATDIDEDADENLLKGHDLGSGMKIGGTDEDALEDDQGGGTDDEEEGETELSDEDLLEVPVSDMTTRQLKRAAKVIGYDYKADGVKKTKVLREKMTQKLAAR